MLLMATERLHDGNAMLLLISAHCVFMIIVLYHTDDVCEGHKGIKCWLGIYVNDVFQDSHNSVCNTYSNDIKYQMLLVLLPNVDSPFISCVGEFR